MDDLVVIHLPGPPQGKGRARIGKTRSGQAIAFTPAKTRSYEGAIRLAAANAMDGRPPIEGPVRFDLTARVAVPRSWSEKRRRAALEGTLRPVTKPDLSNILKAVEDALNGIVYADDSQIVEYAFVRKIYSLRPEIVVKVQPIVWGTTGFI